MAYLIRETLVAIETELDGFAIKRRLVRGDRQLVLYEQSERLDYLIKFLFGPLDVTGQSIEA